MLLCLVFLSITLKSIIAAEPYFWNNIVPDSVGCWGKNESLDVFPLKQKSFFNEALKLAGDRSAVILSRVYSCKGQPDILLDVYDMSNTDNAFQTLYQNYGTSDDSIFNDMQYINGTLTFWKDHYYISIISDTETKASKEAIFELAYSLADDLVPQKQKMEMISIIPLHPGLDSAIRYFDYYFLFDAYIPISNSKIFNINPEIPAVAACYNFNGQIVKLVLIRYDSPINAGIALSKFKKLSSVDQGVGYILTDAGTWMGFKQIDSLIVLIQNAMNQAQIEMLASMVNKKIKHSQ